MPRVGFRPTTPVSERAKTVHALDRAATVIAQQDYYRYYFYLFLQFFCSVTLDSPTPVTSNEGCILLTLFPRIILINSTIVNNFLEFNLKSPSFDISTLILLTSPALSLIPLQSYLLPNDPSRPTLNAIPNE
jgi:hypothetical protein